jgi:hypothetical protein
MIIAPLNQQQHLEITACGRQFAQIRVVSRSRRRLSSRVAIKALLFPALSRWIYRTCTGIQEGQLSFSLVTLLLHFSAALPTKALGGAALRLCIWVFRFNWQSLARSARGQPAVLPLSRKKTTHTESLLLFTQYKSPHTAAALVA